MEDIYFRIIREGFNSESLFQLAIKLKTKWEAESERGLDKLWVIFDKDSFSPIALNNVIQLCENSPKTESAWSNEAFEIWYLLNYEYIIPAFQEIYINKKSKLISEIKV